MAWLFRSYRCIASLFVLVFLFDSAHGTNTTVCGPARLMRANGYLVSPRYPSRYPKNLDCEWIITAPRGFEISLNFLEFKLESHPNCRKDWVEVRDGRSVGAPKLGRYCGTTHPGSFRSTGNMLYVRFRSDDAKQLKGFKAMYNSSLVCGGTFRRNQGMISSPNYPNAYYDNSDCLFKIEAPRGHIVKITFVDFHLEPAGGTAGNSRCYDYVQVFDGNNVLAPSLGEFCGSLARFHLISTGNTVLVRLVSDQSVHYKGFRLAYSILAPQTTTRQPPTTTPAASPTCLTTQFRCANGKCIDRRWKCDKQDDCRDMSDETGCPCRPFEFRCANGKCQDKHLRCDGRDDCGDWSDERNCAVITTTKPTAAMNCSQGNGGCAHTCAEQNVTGHVVVTCTCSPGFRLHSDGKQCVDINECSDQSKCQHVCVNTPGSYRCDCRRGYYLGQDKSSCLDVDECKLRNNGGCSHVCLNTLGSYLCGCKTGYTLLGDGITCQDQDECQTNNGGCSHTCVNYVGGFKCRCPRGYKMSRDNKTCEDINECARGNGGCEHNCINEPGGYMCECRDGYMQDVMAPSRCMDIDECMEGIPECFNCINLPGSYQCDCGQGFVPNVNKTQCLDVDECKVNNGGCGKHKCINSYGSFSCQCLIGYTLDPSSKKCVDINECAKNGGKGDCEHRCVNTEGSFSCKCRDGFRLLNKYQCVDIDECSSKRRNKCQHKCKNKIGSFSCSCKPGYHLAIDGFSCTKKKAPPGCGIALEAEIPMTPDWQTAKAKSWPWQTLLHLHLGGSFDIDGCMGTLVARQWVLTTAHCLHIGTFPLHPQYIKVELGVHQRVARKSKPELLDVKQVVFHNNFDANIGNLSSNIALVQLSKPVNFTDEIHSICIPTRQETNVLRSGAKGVVIGWGKLPDQKIHNNLRQAEATLVHRHRCSWARRDYDVNKLLCAGFFTSHVTCMSDSGSPLMFPVPHAQNPKVKRWILGGILSWGLNTLSKGCHRDYSHSAYVNIGRYLRWIRSHIKVHKGRRL